MTPRDRPGERFRQVPDGKIFVYIGDVELPETARAPAELYRCLVTPGGERLLLSCVGSIEGFGFERLRDAAPCSGLPLYVASRASQPQRPALWRGLRDDGWNIVSSWIDEAGEGETADFGDLWLRIEREVSESAGVILYAELEDFPLKGAYVEAGMALGMGKPVAVVVPGADLLHPRSMAPIGSWICHPRCRRFTNLQAGRAWIEGPALAAP